MVTKQCTKCLLFKTLNEFRKQTSNRDGLSYYCISCLKPMVKAGNKKRYAEKSYEIIEKSIEWQKNNKEKKRTYMQTWRAKLKGQNDTNPNKS